MSLIYFLKPVGMDGPIKIGFTTMFDKRVMELANWSPIPLELIGTVPGNLSQESLIHRSFADDHSHREWFRATPRVNAFIEAVLATRDLHPAIDRLEPEGHIRRNPTQHSRQRGLSAPPSLWDQSA